MKKVQISNKKPFFVIKPHISKSGKTCFVWNWKDTGFRVENVQLLKTKIEACGGWYKFNTGFPSVYLGGLTLEEMTAIFNDFKWSKPQPKETKTDLKNTKKVLQKEQTAKQTAWADIVANYPAEKVEILRVLMPELFS